MYDKVTEGKIAAIAAELLNIPEDEAQQIAGTIAGLSEKLNFDAIVSISAGLPTEQIIFVGIIIQSLMHQWYDEGTAAQKEAEKKQEVSPLYG